MVVFKTLFIKDQYEKLRALNNVNSRTTVGGLKVMVSNELSLDVAEIRFITGTKPMGNDRLTLEDYNIHNESTITLLVRVLGGAEGVPSPVFDDNRLVLSEGKNIGFGNATKLKAVCWDEIESGSNEWHFKIHNCSHIICTSHLSQKIKSTANSGSNNIYCPHTGCNTLLDFNEIIEYSGIIEEEQKTLEERFAKNTVIMSDDLCECPNGDCHTFLFRDNVNLKRVRCPTCRAYDFCFSCSNRWNSRNLVFCGNESCCEGARRIQILENYETITVSGQSNVPGARLCPACEKLLYHEGIRCKHATCPLDKGGCNHKFCWVCLTPGKNCKLNEHCVVADTQIPTLHV